MKKILFIVISVCVIFVICYYLLNIGTDETNKLENGEGFNKTIPGIEDRTNVLSIGLYEENGDIIDYDLSRSETLKKVLVFRHLMDFEREYGLIVLSDYKQTNFAVEGEDYNFYTFMMEKNTSKQIPIEMELGPDIKEISFLVIKDPNHLLKEKNIDYAQDLQQIIGLRFSVNDESESNINLKYENQLVSYSELLEPIFISKSKKELQFLYEGFSNDKVYMHLGNENNYQMDYAIISFLNWEQVPFNNDLVKYASVESEKRNVYSFNLPRVDDISNYQVITFPLPYKMNQENEISRNIYGSLRTIIKPNK